VIYLTAFGTVFPRIADPIEAKQYNAKDIFEDVKKYHKINKNFKMLTQKHTKSWDFLRIYKNRNNTDMLFY